MQKNIYLANFSMTINPGEHRFLPYSVAGLWSYAKQDEKIAKSYCLDALFFEKENNQEIIKRLQNPFLIGFSVYVWNEQYTNNLSKLIKQQFPDCIIVYGGPQVPNNKNDLWYKENKHVDIVVFQEGEETFKNILLNPIKEEIVKLPNVAVNIDNKWQNNLQSKKLTRLRDLSKLPSPYTSNVMPKVDTNHAMLIETNRGCPYACNFCDWGSLTYNKLVNHSMQRLKEEIEYAGKNKISFLYAVDANFGIVKERDEQIADWIIATKEKYGYPKTFFVNWAKNANDTIIRIAKKLYDAELIKSFNMSLQTLTPLALELTKRDNLDINQYQELADKCKSIGLPYDSELIIGNPGETVDTWKDTYLELTKHSALTTYLYPLALLPNAQLSSKENRKQFEFKTVKRPFPGVLNEDTKEEIELVIQTKWLSEADLKYLWKWTWVTRNAHEFNFLRDAVDYLEKHNIVSRKDFYDAYYDFVVTGDGFVKKHFKKASDRIDNYIFGLASQSLGYRESMTEHRDLFYAEAKEFLKRYNLDADFCTELLDYCDARVYNYNIKYPFVKKFSYNFLDDKKEDVSIEFKPTLFGATSTTAHMLLNGSSKITDNFKVRQTLTCTLMEPTIV